jgi:hypothetical protein
MAGTRPTIIAIQDLHRRTHLHHQAATMDSPPQTSQTSFTKEPTSIIGPSSKARSSNVSWPRTFRVSTMKKLQDEACLLHQPCISHHQHSSSRRKIERGRGNRSCSTNPERRRRTKSKNTYRDLFAKDIPKGMAAHYNFLTESIITDLERAIQNITPPTSNVMTHYRAMKERLLSKHGPNSQKDAEETRKKLEGLHGDHRGWDVFLAAHDSLVEVLSKTPVRDTANNPVMQPVSIRPHIPVPPPTASLAAFIAYAAADAANQQAWELLHPNNKTMNHRPTDAAIRNIAC